MAQFVQQLANGVAKGSYYALIALGYTMVYGIIQLINFAHGEVFMLGAFIGLWTFNFGRRAFGWRPGRRWSPWSCVLADGDAVDPAGRRWPRALRLPAAAQRPPAGAAHHRPRVPASPSSSSWPCSTHARLPAFPELFPDGSFELSGRTGSRCLWVFMVALAARADGGARGVRPDDPARQGHAGHRRGPGHGQAHGHRRRHDHRADLRHRLGAGRRRRGAGRACTSARSTSSWASSPG